MGPRTRRGPTLAAAVALALLSAASLGVLGWHRLADPAVATADTATVAGLTAQLHRADWVPLDHVHDGEGGFLMPDQMMPGAPSGDQVRLGVSLTLSNTGRSTQEFTLIEEFHLVGGRTAQPAPVSADSIGELPRLGPGAAVDGILYFDVEVPDLSDPPLSLQWTRDGATVALAVPLPVDRPEHQHG